jgi:hypothetical protein
MRSTTLEETMRISFDNMWVSCLSFILVVLFWQPPAHAAAPTFVQEAETIWNMTTSPKTTSSFNVNAGDILVAYLISESWDSTNLQTYAISDSVSLTWTQKTTVQVSNYCWISIWTATVASTGSMTVSFSQTGGATTTKFGGNVLTFRGSSGVGTGASTTIASAAPSLNYTTTAANSAIVVVSADWNAGDGSTRTWRANAGTLTEQTYARDSVAYTVYGGYHADAGAAGTYAVGLSAPSGQKVSIAAIEVKGTSATPVKHKVISD